MMHDRQAINGVQVRLLLSSRAEMQKVIETARQQSLRALQNSVIVTTATVAPKATPPSITQKVGTLTKPQPPVITTNSLQCILSNSLTAITPSFLAYQQQAGISIVSPSINSKTLNDADDVVSQKHRCHRSISSSRSRSRSRSRERSSSRKRRERSRERSRGLNENIVTRRRGNSRDRSIEPSRSRSNSRDKSRDSVNNRDLEYERTRHLHTGNTKSQENSIWGVAPSNSIYSTTSTKNQTNIIDANSKLDDMKIGIGEPDEKSKSLASINNYSLSSFLNSSNNSKGFALQNPYTAALNMDTLTTTSSSAIPGIFVEKKAEEIEMGIGEESSLPQENIVFADTNPYEKMYPNLFAQAAAIGTSGQKAIQSKNMQTSPVSPKEEDQSVRESDPLKTRCIKIMNMCPGTTYSDIRKFCVGLYIPHNGIKMVNDVHGMRVGMAYVQFSKYTCVARALSRNNRMLRNKAITIEAVSEEEFEEVTDSYHPDNHDRPSYSGNRGEYHSETFDGQNASNPFKNQLHSEPFCVLYIEDIPALTTEQDIMKMFSSYSLYDILLLASPENRREFVAHVRFSREDDAVSAFEDKAHHQIGYRRLRVRPGSLEEMDRAKEKIRLANEQLMKEEQAAAEEEERRKKREDTKANKQREIISLDLTQSDGEDDVDSHDFIHNTNRLIDNVVKTGSDDDNCKYYDGYDTYKSSRTDNDDPSPTYNNDIKIQCDYDSNSNSALRRVKDPRLRKNQREISSGICQSGPMSNNGGPNNFNNFNPNFNDQQIISPPVNNIEQNFVILKNCEYGARINDVAQLLITANLALKHIEPLTNERQLPTGEFIVEFRRTQDAEIAVDRFHNIQFMNRSLRVFPITPQEIANRLGKPFLGYIPGGNGMKVSDLKTLAAAMNGVNNSRLDWNPGNNNNFNLRGCGSNPNRFESNDVNYSNRHCNMNEENFNSSLPERFNRPGCVLELENVPYKAQLSDILNFFQGFDVKSDDIIRRFNDNGQPTGDARVAFDSPEAARKAFDARKRKQIFNRTIYLNIL